MREREAAEKIVRTIVRGEFNEGGRRWHSSEPAHMMAPVEGVGLQTHRAAGTAHDRTMIYVYHAALAVTVFLVMLNGFLRGSRKAQIDAVLSVILVGLLVIGFIAFGWILGGVALILAFVYAKISRPLAAATAARLFSAAGGWPSGRHKGLPDPVLERISRELGRQRSPEQVMSELRYGGGSRRADALSDLLDYCTAKPDIQEVMRSFDLDRTELEDLYTTLVASGAGQWAGGHWVAASTLADPESLRFLVRRRRRAPDRGETLEAIHVLFIHFERGGPLRESKRSESR